MSRSRIRTGYGKQLLLLGIVPLAIMSTGYALFSKSLALTGTVAKPTYSSSQYMNMSYTKTETPNGSNTNYSLSTIIKNKGVTSVTAWQLKFDVPSNVTTVTCQSTVTCTKSGVTVTVVNGSGNGTVAAGASTPAFTISFTSATAKYTLQNIYISGTYSTAYQTIAGLTITRTLTSSSKSGANWTYNYSFTVTNGTTQNLSAWQAVCTWSAKPTSSTISTTVNYVTSASSITFTSKTALAASNNITFTGTFVIKSSTWTISGCTVRGRA